MMSKKISFTLNDEITYLEVSPNETLLEVLRNRVGVKSPKCGCARGDCGTCTIMLDDRSVKSCLILAIEVDGSKIITLEGLMKDGLSDLQKSFLDHNSFQCAFCAPGMVMAAHSLLEKNKNPSEGEVKEALSGNLCRCTGYLPIIEAILHGRI